MSPHFLKEEEKKAKKANDDNLESGICEAEGGGCGCEQTVPSVVQRPGREPWPPDSTRDNEGLSRHHYLLQQSTGTGRWTFSRERCMQLLGGPHLAGGMRLVWV